LFRNPDNGEAMGLKRVEAPYKKQNIAVLMFNPRPANLSY
jgi:hypothetical protein